jgi:hypothetical protein
LYPIQDFVAHWTKYNQLIDILVINMSDIMERFRDGALKDFEPRELVGLITALFSDSAMRRSNIKEIEGGT